MKRRYESGQSTPQISEAMNCPLPTVWWTLQRLGVQCRPTSDSLRGRKLSVEHIRKVVDSRKGYRHSDESRRKMSRLAKQRGPYHNWYVDGHGKFRDTLRKQEMDRLEYRLWREHVFKRDLFTCQECGRRGGMLHADHIVPWRDDKESRYKLSNGRTLCVECHQKTPTYGFRSRRLTQLTAF